MNIQAELAAELAEQFEEDGHDDLTVLDILDSLASLGFELRRSGLLRSSPAAEAYYDLLAWRAGAASEVG